MHLLHTNGTNEVNMQLSINIRLNGKCVLPLGYHHIQQSAIYSLIGGELHDNGYQYDKREYKLFTFGPIEGRYTIQGKYITFYDEIIFEVRCFDDDIGLTIIKNITSNGIRLLNNIYKDVEVKIHNREITTNELRITMKSPICVYKTDDERKTIYFNPNEEEFFESVRDNFVRKYYAVAGEYPISTIDFGLIKFSQRDRYLTKYKGFYIEGWKGVYELSGNTEYLNFLYNTGLGAKNSQGFGMFEVMDMY